MMVESIESVHETVLIVDYSLISREMMVKKLQRRALDLIYLRAGR